MEYPASLQDVNVNKGSDDEGIVYALTAYTLDTFTFQNNTDTVHYTVLNEDGSVYETFTRTTADNVGTSALGADHVTVSEACIPVLEARLPISWSPVDQLPVVHSESCVWGYETHISDMWAQYWRMIPQIREARQHGNLPEMYRLLDCRAELGLILRSDLAVRYRNGDMQEHEEREDVYEDLAREGSDVGVTGVSLRMQIPEPTTKHNRRSRRR
jgi:hypothetical protein